jgi:DNA-binding transcriptional ArsR family regulator
MLRYGHGMFVAEQTPPRLRADFSPVAALLADKARAAMLSALLDGSVLAAGELSKVAGVSAATASAHLSRLLEGGMVRVTRQGRHRYYQLAGHEIAEVIEVLSQISPAQPVRSLRESREAAALAEARTCYDHLAGRAGVALLDSLLSSGLLAADGEVRPAAMPATGLAVVGPLAFEVTAAGALTLGSFGVDVAAARRSRRRFAGACLDWTQRRPHLNGALGAAITARLFDLDWITRGPGKRGVRITPAGQDGLASTFGLTSAEPEQRDSEAALAGASAFQAS